MKQRPEELKAKEILDYCILNLTGDYKLKDDKANELYKGMLQEIKNLFDKKIKDTQEWEKEYLKKQQSKPQRLFSNCCGASSKGGEDYEICSECGEHCEYNDEEDETEIN